MFLGMAPERALRRSLAQHGGGDFMQARLPDVTQGSVYKNNALSLSDVAFGETRHQFQSSSPTAHHHDGGFLIYLSLRYLPRLQSWNFWCQYALP